jgi:hypothetical protein
VRFVTCEVGQMWSHDFAGEVYRKMDRFVIHSGVPCVADWSGRIPYRVSICVLCHVAYLVPCHG